MNNPRITNKEVGIIKKAQAGDMSAFNKLFYKYKTFVADLIEDYIHDRDEAEDLVNVVFMKVYDKLSTFQDYSSFGGWLRIVTQRAAIDYLRKNKNQALSIPEVDDEGLSLNTFGEGTEDDIVNHLTYLQLLEEIKKLPERKRKIFLLFYRDNMTVEEISNALNVPTGTVKSALTRTRRRLFKKLKTL